MKDGVTARQVCATANNKNMSEKLKTIKDVTGGNRFTAAGASTRRGRATPDIHFVVSRVSSNHANNTRRDDGGRNSVTVIVVAFAEKVGCLARTRVRGATNGADVHGNGAARFSNNSRRATACSSANSFITGRARKDPQSCSTHSACQRETQFRRAVAWRKGIDGG